MTRDVVDVISAQALPTVTMLSTERAERLRGSTEGQKQSEVW